jgi:hypothetical protein
MGPVGPLQNCVPAGTTTKATALLREVGGRFGSAQKLRYCSRVRPRSCASGRRKEPTALDWGWLGS